VIYILETYIEPDALFSPNIWAEFATTTNSCESFHAKLNFSFGAAHYTPQHFCTNIFYLEFRMKFTFYFGAQHHDRAKKHQKKNNFYKKRWFVLSVEN